MGRRPSSGRSREALREELPDAAGAEDERRAGRLAAAPRAGVGPAEHAAAGDEARRSRRATGERPATTRSMSSVVTTRSVVDGHRRDRGCPDADPQLVEQARRGGAARRPRARRGATIARSGKTRSHWSGVGSNPAPRQPVSATVTPRPSMTTSTAKWTSAHSLRACIRRLAGTATGAVSAGTAAREPEPEPGPRPQSPPRPLPSSSPMSPQTPSLLVRQPRPGGNLPRSPGTTPPLSGGVEAITTDPLIQLRAPLEIGPVARQKLAAAQAFQTRSVELRDGADTPFMRPRCLPTRSVPWGDLFDRKD